MKIVDGRMLVVWEYKIYSILAHQLCGDGDKIFCFRRIGSNQFYSGNVIPYALKNDPPGTRWNDPKNVYLESYEI